MSYGGGAGLGCLTAARFTMKATILHRDENYAPIIQDNIDADNYGKWVRSQDPLTKEIVRVWKPFVDDDTTPEVNEEIKFGEINCLVRGIVDGGIRVAGTTERFGDTYENIDYAKMWVPANVRITKRDRITNIRDATGRVRWRDEEFEKFNPNNPTDLDDPSRTFKATEFNVNGVTPLFNAFNVMTEQFVLLEKAEVDSE